MFGIEPKLIVACAGSLLLHITSTIYVENTGTDSIIDQGFNYIPKLNISDGSEHWLAFGYPIFTLCVLYYNSVQSSNNRLLYRFLLNGAIIMMLRSVTITATILPATKTCPENHLMDIASKMRGGCYDKIFSGHMSYLTLSVLYLVHLNHSKLHYLAILVEGYLLVGMREHYTIDVLLAVIITVLVYKRRHVS